MMDPRYREIKQAQIPKVITADGATVRIISGDVNGVKGPVRGIVTDPEMLDVSLPAGKMFTREVNNGHTVFATVVEGSGRFDPWGGSFETGAAKEGGVNEEGDLVLYGPGESIVVTTDNKPVRFLLISGRPIKEPIAWAGPVVMNTEDQLRRAFEEFSAGTFVKAPHKEPSLR